MGSCARGTSAWGEGGTSQGTTMGKHSSLVSQLALDPEPGWGFPTAELTSPPWGQGETAQRVPRAAQLRRWDRTAAGWAAPVPRAPPSLPR